MAVLNIASKFKSEYLDSNYNNALIFTTEDKHIITHGVDFLSDYTAGVRGLVPNYDNTITNGILGKNGWQAITTSILPIASNLAANDDTTIFTSKQVQDLIKNGFAANDAMVFKGVLVKSDITGKVNTYNNVPSSGYSAGWTYRIAEAGDYAGIKCEVGDFVIAVTDAESNQTEVRNSHWSVVQTNIVGTATIKINGVEYQFATNTNQNVSSTFVAPTTVGSTGQILSTDVNKNLVWVDQSTIDAGKLDGKEAVDFVWDVNTSNDGTISITKGSNTSTKSIVAASLKNALTIGTGLKLVDNTTTFDGSVAKELILKPATKTSLGGIMIDNAVGSENSDKSTVSIDSDGRLYLTQNNIINALGFRPTAPSDVMEYNIVNRTEDGIVPKLITTNTTEITPGHYMLAFSGVDTQPSWYKLSSKALNNTWRPIQVNSQNFLDSDISADADSRHINFIAGDNITLTPNGNNLTIIAKDTTYEKVTVDADGLMSKEDFVKLGKIEEEAQKNVPAFAVVSTTSGSATATTVQDTLSLTGENITIGVNGKAINFKVAMLEGATESKDGSAGLVTAPKIADRSYFLRGDGVWAAPVQRQIKVDTTTLSNNGLLEIKGEGGTTVSLSTTGGNTLTIKSIIYQAGTGISHNTVGNTTTFALAEATTSTLGGIKIAAKRDLEITTNASSSDANRFYGVEIDKNGKAFVNVPWTDLNNTWRPVSINSLSIGEKDLNYVTVPNSSIGIFKNETATEVQIGFELLWYNLDTGEYEE